MTPVRLKKVCSFIGPMQQGSKLTQFEIRYLTVRIDESKTMENLIKVLKKSIGINQKTPPSSPRINIFDSLLKIYQTFQEKGDDENQLTVSKRVLQILISNESDIIDQIPISPIKKGDMLSLFFEPDEVTTSSIEQAEESMSPIEQGDMPSLFFEPDEVSTSSIKQAEESMSPIKQDDMPNCDPEIYILMRMLNRIMLDSAGKTDYEVFNSFFKKLKKNVD